MEPQPGGYIEWWISYQDGETRGLFGKSASEAAARLLLRSRRKRFPGIQYEAYRVTIGHAEKMDW